MTIEGSVKMKNLMYVLGILTCTASSAVVADSSIVDIVVGVKAWYATWQTYSPEQIPASNGASIGGAQNYRLISADGHFDYIPNIAARFGQNKQWFASVSQLKADRAIASDAFFAAPGAPLPLYTSRIDHLERKETDYNIGYSLTPNFLISAGYKSYKEDRKLSAPAIGLDRVNLSSSDGGGPLIGMSFTSPISDVFSGYAQFAFSRVKGDLNTDAGTSSKITSDYYVAELGVAHFFSMERFLKGVSLSAGYRSQLARTVAPNVGTLPTSERLTVTDSRSGIVAGLNGVF